MDSRYTMTTRSYFVLALILPIFAMAPLCYPGYIQTHSGFIPLWNIADLREHFGLLNWKPHFAVRFDSWRSDGLLPYYLAAFLPLDPATAVKIILGMSWLLGSAGMASGLKRWVGVPGALVGALVYTYLPYHLATVYVRGAWGEALFWGILPWSMFVLPYQDPVDFKPHRFLKPVRFWEVIFSLRQPFLLWLMWSLLGLCHLGLTLWAIVFAIMQQLIIKPHRFSKPVRFRETLLPAILGTATATIINKSLQTAHVPLPYQFTDHLLYPFQLFSAYWGFGISRFGWQDGLPMQIGLAAVGLTIISITLTVRQASASCLSKVDRPDACPTHYLIFFLSAAIIFVLLQLTTVVWYIPIIGDGLTSTLAYPWQLMGFVGLCLAILAGAALHLDDELTSLPNLAAIITLIILSSYPYLNPQFLNPAQMDLWQNYQPVKPIAELGTTQLLLLHPNFEVVIDSQTIGLKQGETSIPLSAVNSLKANDRLLLNVTWQPLQPFDRNWKIFVHLVDSHDNVLAQFDGYPQILLAESLKKQGKKFEPTGLSQWIPGQLVTDTYLLQLPPTISPGPYQVYLGLYDETTLTRMPVAPDSNGRVKLRVE